MAIGTDSSRRIVLYEYTCSGGLLDDDDVHRGTSLLREGWAMLDALAADLAALPHVEIQVLADHRGLPGALDGCEIISVRIADEGRSTLCRLAAEADWTIVIAPEFSGILHDLCQAVHESGGRSLGPSPQLVELLGHKQRTIEHLEHRGVPTPAGCLWRPGDVAPNLRPPLVIKPNDGAGSQETRVFRDREDFESILRSYRRPARIERFVGGLPASVSFLCGPRGAFTLQPCRQRLTEVDGRISYCGGSTPLDEQPERRATLLARRAIDILPATLGYIGVDLVLGEDAGGADDRIIEINPRLTTSYIGLRAAARTNLAMAMLDVAEGRDPDLSFKSKVIEFDSDGTVREC